MSWETFLRVHWGSIAASGLLAVETLRPPAQSPDLNAHAERFVRSTREECLSRAVPPSERHLRWFVQESIKHDHLERNHQDLGNDLIKPLGTTGGGRMACRERLGGPLRYYYQKAREGGGRVERWRGGLGPAYPCSGPFVCRCLTSRTMLRFHTPAHQTGRADFPHPAFGQGLMLSPTERCGRTAKLDQAQFSMQILVGET